MPILFAPSGPVARSCASALCALTLAACSSTTAPTSPTVDIPAPTVAAPAARPGGPIVVFIASAGLLVPVLCYDGQDFVQTDSTQCQELAPEGATAARGHGETLTLGAAGQARCASTSESISESTFDGRKATPLGVETDDYAVWPEAARGLVERAGATLEPTAIELAAMVALLQKETEGLFEVTPKLASTGGLVADVDGDGKPDRVFSAHENGRLYGVVAAFLAKAPTVAVNLSVQQYDYPKLYGSTELDGKDGREIWISATFLEGIEDSIVMSAFSERVIALRNGKAEEVGSFGCRLF